MPLGLEGGIHPCCVPLYLSAFLLFAVAQSTENNMVTHLMLAGLLKWGQIFFACASVGLLSN